MAQDPAEQVAFVYRTDARRFALRKVLRKQHMGDSQRVAQLRVPYLEISMLAFTRFCTTSLTFNDIWEGGEDMRVSLNHRSEAGTFELKTAKIAKMTPLRRKPRTTKI